MTTAKIYNFMGLRKIAAGLSILLLLVSVASLAINGLKFGLDFTGGSLIEVGYQQEPNLNDIRGKLETAGYEDAVVQTFGSPVDILIRMGAAHDPKLGDQVLQTLQSGESQELTLRRNEYVGAQVGEELREQGGLGMLLALFMVMVYVAFRFQLKFSIGAVSALAHDVLIVLGFFSILKLDFDLTVLAALLAVIGYSLNDTIVVSDRIRENFRKLRKGTAIEIMNTSLSQTLGRTLVTSLTTLLVLVALAVFGGEMIHGFAVALLVGVCVGTYSSIYVAANVLVMLGICKEDLMPPEKAEDGEEVDEMP
ncbi:protein translocase subunit SecF [Amphritea balenae]|uniref:Protein-export membrane protein SecF n=1 Tax=Amphritea balenae TaxID=452629 RepID=A0A3P1SR34_9GAMM|nr:protein translocase subunit SecF [Amphritea balenae]RRC99613.1 protein translocase subunit SecF [Amphritea balenae]GGK78391.1 protein-export membrane protein SecF [Amphritea balenae]